MPDRYTYPGSEVLINKLGIGDVDTWKQAETDLIGLRLVHLWEHPIAGSFDLSHLQRIHAYLTQDLYDWGGELRDTDTRPDGTGLVHCRPQFIVPEAERVFGALAELDLLRGLNADRFSERLAWVWGELTTVHPFRDVNTRSQYVFFNQLADEAGWVIDWGGIRGDVMAHARNKAMALDHLGIDALIRPHLISRAEADRIDGLRDRITAAVRDRSYRPGSRDPSVLERELDEARERRREITPSAPIQRSEQRAVDPGDRGLSL